MTNSADESRVGIATDLYDAGFTDVVSVTPPDGQLSPRTTLDKRALGKCPGKLRPDGWVGYRFTDGRPTREETLRWGSWGGNVGLLAEHFPALDIDSEDDALTQAVLDLALELLGPSPVRRSRDPRRLLPYRTDTPFGGRALHVTKDERSHTIEFIGEGQQYVVHGRHPSGQWYRWEGSPLWDRGPGDLTQINEDDADTFLALLKERLEEDGWIPSYSRGRGHLDPSEAPPQAELHAPSLDRLKEVVAAIPNTDDQFPHRSDFIRVGIAIKAAGGEEAFSIFLDWCERWEDGTNDPEYVRQQWDSFKGPHFVGYRFLLGLAGLNDAAECFDVMDAEPGGGSEEHNPALAALRELNETFAVIQVGADVRILQEREGGDIALLKTSDFRLLLDHRSIPSMSGKGRSTPLATAWLKWEGRRQYDDLVFKPGAEDVPANEYNLWTGWGVEPSREGSCDLFLAHLRDTVCDGDEELYEWLLDWLAHLFQQPMEKPGTAVALVGGQGAGKSIVGAVLKVLLGSSHVVAEKSEHVVGKFNSHLENCLVLQCEEAFWGGSKQAAGALKHLVTGETVAIERKFGDRREVPNYTRLLITTNEDRAWPTSIDDRRLTALRVSSARVGDLDYFDAIFAELEAGGYQKLLHVLLSRGIDRARLRRAPVTEAMERQAAEAMSHDEAWLLDFLQAGEIDGVVDPDGSCRVSMEALYSSYIQAHPQSRHAKNKKAFGLWIKDHLKAEKVGRVRVPVSGCGYVRTTEYTLPPLADLRRAYSARGRGANQEWDEPDKWVTIELFGMADASGSEVSADHSSNHRED